MEMVKAHAGVIVGITVLGIVTAVLALGFVRSSAASLSVDSFGWAIFLIPCAIMLVGAFAIAVTARQIGQPLYMAVLVICLVTGIVCMFITSGWLSDASIAQQLLANSPEGTQVTPILSAPITMLRDLAAFVVAPTVGCIAGAWVGSRLHPMRATSSKAKARKK